MLNIFFPAKELMNRFSFPVKFIFCCMLFAVPLSITSVQSVIERNTQLEVTSEHYQGAQILLKLYPIIIELERLRDVAVISRMKQSEWVTETYNKTRANLLKLLNEFIDEEVFNGSQLFKLNVVKLQRSVEHLLISTGSEADMEHTIFEHLNSLVIAGYRLESNVVNDYGLHTNRAVLPNHISSIMMNDLRPVFTSLGELRAYGTSFLMRQMLGSYGINLLNVSQEKLFKSQEQLEQSFTLLLSNYPMFNENGAFDPLVVSRLIDASGLMEEQLLFDPDLTHSWKTYWQQYEQIIMEFNALRNQMALFLEDYYASKHNETVENQQTYIVFIVVLICLFLYLFVGLYLSFRQNMGELKRAAIRVAKGELTVPVAVHSRDEFEGLASLLDEMRIQLKDRQDELLALSITDGLTQIPNRKYFDEVFSEEVPYARENNVPCTLLLLDIDFFKKINDNYGHQAGDLCLQEVAAVLKAMLNRPEDVVARYGGEEFAVILPKTDVTQAKLVAERLCQAIRNLKVKYLEQYIPMTISIGLACTSEIAHATEQSCLGQADEALYEAKRNGRDQWVCSHD